MCKADRRCQFNRASYIFFYTLNFGWRTAHNTTTSVLVQHRVRPCPLSVRRRTGEPTAPLNASGTLLGFILGCIQISWIESMGSKLQCGVAKAIVTKAFVGCSALLSNIPADRRVLFRDLCASRRLSTVAVEHKYIIRTYIVPNLSHCIVLQSRRVRLAF